MNKSEQLQIRHDPFMFLADVHLKPRTWVNNFRVTGDSYKALSLIQDLLDRLFPEGWNTRTLVIGGDWFDSNIVSGETLKASVNFLSCFSKVYYIRGNHDKAVDSMVDIPFNVPGAQTEMVLLDPSTGPVKLPDSDAVYLCGVSWHPAKQYIEQSVQKLVSQCAHLGAKTVYMVLHTATKHLLSYDGAWQIDIDELHNKLADKGDMYIRYLIGDIHTYDYHPIEDRAYAFSPGTLYPLSMDKVSDTFHVSMMCNDGVDSYPIVARTYETFDAATPDLETMIDNLARHAALEQQLPLYIRITGDVSKLPAALKDRTDIILQIKGMNDNELDEIIEKLPSQEMPTIDDAVNVECNDDEDLKEMALELLHSTDPGATLSDWLIQWNAERRQA